MRLSQRSLNFIKRKHLTPFFLIFALIFVRYCYYGFEYFHQLDDYIQYHNYSSNSNNPLGVIANLGLLAARPLAGCADILIWSRFFSFMLAAVAIISAMFAASACIFRWVWSCHFGTGWVFLTVYTLLPLGIEGTYWVSASSRIVAGLFFTSLALYTFQHWCYHGKRRFLLLFAALQLLSFGFYEQALVFSFASALILAVLHLKTNKKRALWSLISFANAAAYFIFTGIFSGSTVYAGRTDIITSYGIYYWKNIFPNVVTQLTDAFLKGGFYTLIKGVWRGAQILLTDMNIIYAAAILLLCAGLFILAGSEVQTTKRPCAAIAAGTLLALAPVSIFFVIENSWFSFRCTVMSFCGIALVADTLVSLAASRLKRGCTAAAVSLLALICCIASISEMHDYRETTLKDREIVDLIGERLRRDGKMKAGVNIAVLNVEPSYLKNVNYYFHEHIHGVTESAWALSGALEWRFGPDRPDVTPLPANPMYRPWNAEASRLMCFDDIYVYFDNTIIKASAVEYGENEFMLYSGGKYIGRVWEEDNHGYLSLTVSD